MYFHFKIETVAQQDKIFQSNDNGNALVSIDLVELMLVLKAQHVVPQDWSMTQMCDMLMAPFKNVFLDGRAALRKDLSTIKCGDPHGLDWTARLAPLKNDPAAHEQRTADIEKQDEDAEVARKALHDAPQSPAQASGKRTAPEPKVDTAKKQKMMSTVTPRVTRASAKAAAAAVGTDLFDDGGVDAIEGDATMFDAQTGPDWEAMYAARAHALRLEHMDELAERVAQAVNDTDDEEMDRSYAPVNDKDHGGRTAPEAVPQQADAAPFDVNSFFV